MILKNIGGGDQYGWIKALYAVEALQNYGYNK